MKKILLLIGMGLMLTGCLESTTLDSGPKTGYHTYGIANITVNIPDEWEIITPDKFGSGVPANTLVAFRSNLKNPYFTPNITILKNPVPLNTQTADYVKSLQHRIASTLISYEDFGNTSIVLNALGKPIDTSIIKSQGAEAQQSDIKYFVHAAVVVDDSVYTAIGTSLATADEGEKEKIETIVSSLAIK